MKKILGVTLIILSVVSCSSNPPLGLDRSEYAEDFGENEAIQLSKKLDELKLTADMTVGYNGGGSLDIGLDELFDLFHDFEGHNFTNLEHYFDVQRRKDLIIVSVCKNSWTKKKLLREVTKVKKYFTARGYTRIVVRQASSGINPGLLLDFTNKSSLQNNSCHTTSYKAQ